MESKVNQIVSPRSKWQQHAILYAMLVGGVVLLAIAVYLWFRPADNATYRLRMSAGSTESLRHRTLAAILDRTHPERIDVELMNTTGSVNALDQVDAGILDLALIQGGLDQGDRANITQVAVFRIEPLHLLVREELHQEAAKQLHSLKGKRINIGPPGSGTAALASLVLDYTGFSLSGHGPKADFVAQHQGRKKLLDQLERIKQARGPERDRLIQQLPDALFVVERVPSQLAKSLVTAAGYRLVPIPLGKVLPFHDAAELVENEAWHNQILESHIESALIPAFSYSYDPPVPAEPCETIGARKVLVAHQDVPVDAVLHFLEVVHDGPYAKLFDSPDPGTVVPQYPLHRAALRYRDRNKPIVTEDFVSWIQSIASAVGLFCGGILAIYGYFRWRGLLHFDHFFQEVRRINLLARGIEIDTLVPDEQRAKLQTLEEKLDDLKGQAIAAFTSGRFYGEGIMGALSLLIADTRASIREVLRAAPNESAESKSL